MPIIMVTNDDGIHSPGLKALQKAMTGLGQTVVVAPERDNSAVSHALTMSRPLRIRQTAANIFTLDGTPTDCVAVGIGKILGQRPDLLVSGINAGPNLGDDISYSGTVSAAIEGTMYGIPSLALSLAGDPPFDDYSLAMEVAACLARRILADGLPDNTLLNVNIPSQSPFKGFIVSRQGRRLWENSIQETFDPWGRKHYWIGGGTPLRDSAEDTDVSAVHNGFVSVTPIHLDLTNHQGITYLQDTWKLEKTVLGNNEKTGEPF